MSFIRWPSIIHESKIADEIQTCGKTIHESTVENFVIATSL